MLFTNIFVAAAAFTGLAFSMPTQRSAPDVVTAGINVPSCGMVTYSSSIGMPILKDRSCHSFHIGSAELRQYNILSGCACFFFYNEQCGGKYIGWGGPTRGTTSKNGLKGYMCADRAAKLDINPADNGTMTTRECKDGLFEQGLEATLVDLDGDAEVDAVLIDG